MSRKRVYPIFETNDDASSSSSSKKEKNSMLKIWSWNVSGLRACVKKGCADTIKQSDADIFIMQEMKCNEWPGEINKLVDYGFKKLHCSKERAGGYSGVGLLAKEKPVKCTIGVGDSRFDNQGRFIHAEYEDFHLINAYVPNSGRGLVNLKLRKEWEDLILQKLVELDKNKPVIYAGDLNVAHEEIDLKNPKANANKTAGFTDQERNDFTRLLEAGFIDVYRHLNPKKEGAYTFWSYLGNARSRNVGWRLDYFVVSERLIGQVEDCQIHTEFMGSDHCPISLSVRL